MRRSVMKKNAKAAAPPPKRGKCMTLPQIELVEAAYKKAKEDNPHLSTVGFSRLALPPSIKATFWKEGPHYAQGGEAAYGD